MMKSRNRWSNMHNIGSALVTLVLAGFGILSTASAQVPQPEEFGVLLLFNYNIHTTKFQELPDIPNCCPEFTSGDGYGYAVGLVYARDIGTDISVSGRLLFSDASAKLVAVETLPVSINGETMQGTFEHSIDATIRTFGFEPLVHYRLIGKLRIGAGLNISAVTTHTFLQQEYLLSPAHGVFANGTRYRNQADGEIPRIAGGLISGEVTADIHVPLDAKGSVILHPEIGYIHGFTDIVDGLNWKPHALRAGLAVTKRF